MRNCTSVLDYEWNAKNRLIPVGKFAKWPPDDLPTRNQEEQETKN